MSRPWSFLSVLLLMVFVVAHDASGLMEDGYRSASSGVTFGRSGDFPAPRDHPPERGEINSGIVDGPNLYAYVRQNPWTKFDPEGLYEEDFHHGAVYYILRARGYDDKTALRIANFSQYVDNNPHTEPIYRTSAARANHHFVGSEPNKATVRDNPEARARVTDAWGRFQKGDGDAAYRLGDALHGYADTFSHEGFTAWHNDKINTRTGSMRPNIGHADAAENGHAPDRPYNDVKKALEAAKGIYDLTPGAPGGKQLPWDVVQKDLTKAFSFNPKTNDDGRNEFDRVLNMRDVVESRFGQRPLYSKAVVENERSGFEYTMKKQHSRPTGIRVEG